MSFAFTTFATKYLSKRQESGGDGTTTTGQLTNETMQNKQY